jgi:2-polyprenyl-3-methyl-5-hydroxy-6-metoxy-1,4-benzoquinol methylase
VNKLCPICNFSNTDEIMELIHTCQLCGHGKTKKSYEIDRFKSYGAVHRFNNFLEELIKVLNYFRAFAILIRVRRLNGFILDSGCGRGEIIDVFEKIGWRGIGTELNARTASDALKKNIKVITSEKITEYANANKGSLDLITSIHNLEHIEDLNLFMETCNLLLKSNGEFVVEVPNFDSYQSKMAGYRWIYLDVDNHRHHFTKKSLGILLSKHGFRYKFLNTWSIKFGTLGMILSILSKVSKTHNAYQFKSIKGLKFGLNLILKSTILVLLAPFGFLLEIITVIFGRGSVIKVMAIKND